MSARLISAMKPVNEAGLIIFFTGTRMKLEYHYCYCYVIVVLFYLFQRQAQPQSHKVKSLIQRKVDYENHLFVLDNKSTFLD